MQWWSKIQRRVQASRSLGAAKGLNGAVRVAARRALWARRAHLCKGRFYLRSATKDEWAGRSRFEILLEIKTEGAEARARERERERASKFRSVMRAGPGNPDITEARALNMLWGCARSLIRLETHTQHSTAHIHIYLFFYIMHHEPFLQMDSCSASGLFIPQFFFLYFSSSSCNTTKVKPGVIRTQQSWGGDGEGETKNVLSKTLGSLSARVVWWHPPEPTHSRP